MLQFVFGDVLVSKQNDAREGKICNVLLNSPKLCKKALKHLFCLKNGQNRLATYERFFVIWLLFRRIETWLLEFCLWRFLFFFLSLFAFVHPRGENKPGNRLTQRLQSRPAHSKILNAKICSICNIGKRILKPGKKKVCRFCAPVRLVTCFLSESRISRF